ncbi:hypothetical protein ANN_05366 [Periplaneta americana]|uniref:Mariner Mos1 transposase n=1 Tax=Periplaneta americana TaxID=6978 RepID=A0ABQ8TC85_PERAM|nr:hypothetical protein ANN_05366 [Periplaneta americana]
MAGLCEGGNEPPGSLKASKKNDAETDQEEKKELTGSMAKKKLSTEGSTGRNGEREKSFVPGYAECLVVDFAKHGITVNAAAYIQTLVKLRRDKRHNINADDVKLLHDNARPHVAASIREKINTFGWEVLQHLPYSPNLAPSDFHLFGPMKKFVAGHRFATDAEV